MQTLLEQHYNKFNEDKRLLRRHGQVEYITTCKYLHQVLMEYENPKVLDLGAGTGRYSLRLASEGYDVTAVELVKYNLGILKKHAREEGITLSAYQGNATKLKRFADDSFDVTLLFGPMYHLYDWEDKRRALSEAKRVTRPGGKILVAYIMNEYSVLVYGFREGHVKECLEDGRLDHDFLSHTKEEDLYSYVRLEEIDRLNQSLGLEREKILAADGPADYLRRELAAMDQETFDLFVKYHLSTCERKDLLGASAHTLDILKV